MIIDNNETEKRAMKEFHLGNRKEGLKIQEEFASAFRTEYAHKDRQRQMCIRDRSMPIRITAPAQKHADITATARNALPYTGRTRSMCQTVCARSLIKKSRYFLS